MLIIGFTTMYCASVGEMYIHLDRYEEAITILKQCVADEPENRTYREFLALAYCVGSYKYWTFMPAGNPIGLSEGHYATTKLQVDEAQASVQKAQELQVQTPSVQGTVNTIHVNVQSMLKRHFHGNRFAANFAILLGVLLLFGGNFLWRGYLFADNLFGGIYLFSGLFYMASCYTPQYLVNRRVIEGKALSRNFLESIVLEGGVGCAGTLIGVFIIVLTLPVVTVVNIMRNWVLAPQPTAAEKQRLAILQTPRPQAMPEIVDNQQQQH